MNPIKDKYKGVNFFGFYQPTSSQFDVIERDIFMEIENSDQFDDKLGIIDALIDTSRLETGESLDLSEITIESLIDPNYNVDATFSQALTESREFIVNRIDNVKIFRDIKKVNVNKLIANIDGAEKFLNELNESNNSFSKNDLEYIYEYGPFDFVKYKFTEPFLNNRNVSDIVNDLLKLQAKMGPFLIIGRYVYKVHIGELIMTILKDILISKEELEVAYGDPRLNIFLAIYNSGIDGDFKSKFICNIFITCLLSGDEDFLLFLLVSFNLFENIYDFIHSDQIKPEEKNKLIHFIASNDDKSINYIIKFYYKYFKDHTELVIDKIKDSNDVVNSLKLIKKEYNNKTNTTLLIHEDVIFPSLSQVLSNIIEYVFREGDIPSQIELKGLMNYIIDNGASKLLSRIVSLSVERDCINGCYNLKSSLTRKVVEFMIKKRMSHHVILDKNNQISEQHEFLTCVIDDVMDEVF